MLGIPVIVRAIQICQESGVFSSIVVSTDSEEIMSLAKAAGAQVHIRPSKLAGDHVSLLPVIAEATAHMDPDTPICCVYATAVTLRPQELSDSWLQFQSQQADRSSNDLFLTGVVRYPHPIQRAMEMGPDGQMSMVAPEYALTRTQDLPERWHDAGVFIWGTAQTWSKSDPVLTRAKGFPLAFSEVIDLDTEDDWQKAEALLAIRESTS